MQLKVNVFDVYNEECLGGNVTLIEAATLKAERIEDSDGECEVRCFSVLNGKDVTHLMDLYVPDFEY